MTTLRPSSDRRVGGIAFVEPLKKKLDEINAMSQSELKTYYLDKLRNTGARGLFWAERPRNPISAVHKGSIHTAPGVRGTGTTGESRSALENSA